MSEIECSALGLKWGIRVRKGLACKTCGRVLLHPANVSYHYFYFITTGEVIKSSISEEG